MLAIDPATGIILLYGLYPILSVKGLIFAFISGVMGGILVLFERKKSNLIKSFGLRFIIAFFIGYIVYGITKDYLEFEPKEYVACIVGFLSYPAFKWIFSNIDEIVESILKKGFKKVGLDLDKIDRKNEDNDNAT